MTAVLRLLALQGAGWLAALVLLWSQPAWMQSLLAGGTAAGLAALTGRRFVPMHALMPPLCVFALLGGVPPWVWLAAALLTWALGAGAFRYRVPLYLSNRHALARLETLIPPGARVIDLGAGTGSALVWLARRRKDLSLSGVEMALLPWLIGKWRLRASPVGWCRGDAFDVDLSAYDVAYAYLSPAPMVALWHKACSEMADGALLISNSFGIDGVPPWQRHPVGDWKHSELLVWRPGVNP
ncbi:hypothetical protein [Jeongeupia sp. USM3]|uniref:hypothetical protein n=1 Tax=Jeongeupia sp. USM3 TaxID=1906741 RepID=UPI00089E0505|nr:hypothetical protein [Jeongeupia sp. USM3]AOX99471.1 hypothetical protein BJP62_02765 [Jeongeupia sp. USM3]